MINFIKELLDIYEYEVLKEENNYLILKDMQTNEIFKKKETELYESFLKDYNHKINQSNCDDEINYYMSVVTELENLLKIIPEGTKIKLLFNGEMYYIKGNDYENTEEFENLNYYVGKKNDGVNDWIMVLREEFNIVEQ